MTISPEQIAAGHAIYTKRTLQVYNFVVLGISNYFIWKCATKHIVAHYNRNVSANHLDVGVGTGYFLKHCKFPSLTPRIALVDLNQHALDFASAQIAQHCPKTFVRNVLEPIELDVPKFDSVGINFLLHCIPGSMESKAVAFEHLKAHMNPGATFFGSTILHSGVRRNWAARQLMAAYNRKGVFSNENDHLPSLNQALSAHFHSVRLEVIGCVALFSGQI